MIWEAEPSATPPLLIKSYSSYSGFYFLAHSAPVKDADQRWGAHVLVPMARRGGREDDARPARLGWGTHRGGEAVVWSG